MNTHWIDYIPGGVARVTDKEPVDEDWKLTASEDVNMLSREVSKMHRLICHASQTPYLSIALLVNSFKTL